MAERRIVAIGGAGFAPENESLLRYVCGLAPAERPRVLFLGTATGDTADYIVRFYDAFGALGCRTAHLALFGTPEPGAVARALGEADVIYVGGGNTANLLAVWRVHGVDRLLEDAWARGAVLTGTSAGANCWFEACTTDSFGPIGPLRDGLGFLAGSFCPHYDGEADRRPAYRRLVDDGFPAGWAADDAVALRFAGTELAEVVSAVDGKRAYRVEPGSETTLDTRLLA